MYTLFAFLGPMEIAIIAVIALLLFGRKLPSMGRSIGQTIVEFKKGVKGMEDDIDGGAPVSTSGPTSGGGSQSIQAPAKVSAPAPKFEDVPSSSKPEGDK